MNRRSGMVTSEAENAEEKWGEDGERWSDFIDKKWEKKSKFSEKQNFKQCRIMTIFLDFLNFGAVPKFVNLADLEKWCKINTW